MAAGLAEFLFSTSWPENTYELAVLADSPVAYWRLNESSGTQADDSINSHNGVFTNTPTLNADSIGNKTGTAVTFNGTDEYILTTAIGTFGSTLDSGFTIEFWCRHTTTALCAALGVLNTGTTTAFVLFFNRNESGANVANTHSLLIRDNDGTPSANVAFTATLNDNNWHHVVVRGNPSANTWSVRVDKVDRTPTVAGGGAFGGTANFEFPLALGANNSRGTIGDFYPGSLDEVALYLTELTNTRVDAHFDAAAIPLLSTLTDNFDDNIIDGAKWDTVGTVAETGGQVVITPALDTDGWDYPRYQSDLLHSIVTSEVIVKVPQTLTDIGGEEETVLFFGTGSATYIGFIKTGANLVFRDNTTGAHNDTSVTYSSTTHLWWRLRESGGSILWDTSTDGSTWTNRRTKVPDSSAFLKRAQLRFGAGFWGGTGAGAGTAIFDNLNDVGVTLIGVSDSVQLSASETVATSATVPISDAPQLSSADAVQISATVPVAESGTVQSSDTISMLASLAIADSGELSASETPVTIISISVDDTGSISSTDALTISVTVPPADTAQISSSDVPTILAFVPISDATQISSADTAQIAVPIQVSESGQLSAAEVASVLATIPVVDTGSLSAAEALTISATIAIVESGTLSSSEVVAVGAPINVSDSGTLAASETLAVLAQLPILDSTQISSADALLIAVTVPRSDSGQLSSSDVVTSFNPITVADSGQVLAVETLQLSASITQIDTGQLSSSDLAAILAPIQISESGLLSAIEQVFAVDLSSTFGRISLLTIVARRVYTSSIPGGQVARVPTTHLTTTVEEA
jgi:hypothetical protein